MSFCKFSVFIFLVFVLSFQNADAQETLSPAELEKFLDRAELQSQNYSRVFRNLSAEESKTKTFYKADGAVEEKRRVKSFFIVYQSTTFVDEFRFVLEFNGKSVARDEKEAAKFFDKLAKAKNYREEHEKLKKESLRFDGAGNPWGTTMFQMRPMISFIRGDFEFRLLGREKIGGRDAWAIEYEQTKTSSHILSNPLDTEIKEKTWYMRYDVWISDAFRPTNVLLKGKLVFDAETAQMLRNEHKVYLNPKILSKPVLAQEAVYEYQPSEFGISVPKRFWMLTFDIKGKDDQSLIVRKRLEFNYDYSKFSEFKTEVKDFQIKGK